MKIAFINDMIYPFNIGGTEVKIYELAKRLAKDYGYEVHWFGVKLWKGPDTIKKGGIILHGICRYKNLYNFGGKRTILEPLKFALKVYPELAKHKFDLIDCSAFVYFHCFPVALAAKRKATPLIITWNQFWGNYWYEYLGKFKGLIGKTIEKLTIHLTNNHIAISKTTKKELISRGIKKENVYLGYGGVDIGSINRIQRQQKKYDLIYVGRLNHQKNVKLLIKTTAILKNQFPEIKVCIIGNGPDRKNLEELAVKLDLSRNIEFNGFITEKKEIYKKLKSSKIFILPSILEGLGMVVIEAHASGIPVIVIKNKWNAAQELIENGKNGFISENNAEKLANLISKILKNKKLQEHMSNYARKSAKRFDWDKLTKDLDDYYKRIMQQNTNTK